MSPAARRLDGAELVGWLRLARSDNVGPRTFRSLIARFGTAGAAIEALPGLVRRPGGRPVTLAPLGEVEREMDALRRAGATILPSCDPRFPPLLKGIDSVPPLLTVVGDPAVLARPMVAIVGSRNASAGGLVLTERFARGLGEAGYVVVSGLARGIDARAHAASLATGTIGVLAGGHDRLYPSEHAGLARRIAETGAVISEMPFAWEPRGRDFPRRNRIVSGLSFGVLVMEAALRSGSLITARFAGEQGRLVFAVPGSPLEPRAEGTNDLIRNGAILCAGIDHLIEDLGPMARETRLPFSLREDDGRGREALWDESDVFAQDGPPPTARVAAIPDDEDAAEAVDRGDAARLLDLLGAAPVAVDELIRLSGLTTGVVQALLLDLELGGAIVRSGAGTVTRRPA